MSANQVPAAVLAVENTASAQALAASPDRTNSAATAEVYRRWCVNLIVVALVIDALLAIALGIIVDPDGAGPVAWVIAALLIVSRMLWPSGKAARAADCLGVLSLMWVATLACGTMATISLRLGMPAADQALFTTDRALGIDPTRLAALLTTSPPRLVSAMANAYNDTMPIVVLATMATALLGKRIEAWRAAFCYVGGLWSACLISIMVPAKGVGVWFSDALVSRLPERAARYAFPTFDRFHGSTERLFRLDMLQGVVTFPSFHTIMGLILLAVCRGSMLLVIPAAAWFLLMMGATVPLGGHYVVDLVGGAVTWAAWFYLSVRIAARPQRPFRRAPAD
jgi:membrane-associated phospholipid phosphatase